MSRSPLFRVLAGSTLALAALAPGGAGQVNGEVLAEHEIADAMGGFTGALDDGDGFGFAASPIGDLNDDGVLDLAVGAWGDDDGGTDRGAVWILFLDAAGDVASHQKISDTQGGFTGVLGNDDRFGYAIAPLGDHDGDGVEDLAVGALFDDDGGYNHGAIWILFLNADGTVKAHQKISDTEGGFEPPLHFRDYLGASLTALGDVDGDGVGDIASGAYRDGDGEYGTIGKEGSVWIIRLQPDGTVKSTAKIGSQVGGLAEFLSNRDEFGRAVANIGDLDGDGIDDLAVGAPLSEIGGEYQGAVWILFLDADSQVKAYQRLAAGEGGVPMNLVDDQDRFGFAVGALGDANADGTPDVAVGAIRRDDGGLDRGAVHVFFLAPDGTVEGTRTISDTQGFFDAKLQNRDRFGHAIAPIGDHDGDGVLELALGAPYRDTGGDDRGAIFFVDFKAAPTVSWENIGYSLAGEGQQAPLLVGFGSLADASPYTLVLQGIGPPGVQTEFRLYMALDAAYRPFFGGVLVPNPTGSTGSVEVLLSDLDGNYFLRTRWPPDLASGTTTFFQAWAQDPSGPEGWIGSNTVVATSP